MLAPLLLGFALVYLYPLARTLWMSTRHAPGTPAETSAGASHYLAALQDPLLWLAVVNTVGFSIAFVVIQLPIALALALLLSRFRGKSRGLWRLAFFSTHLVGSAFAGVLLQTMLTGRRGFFNAVLLQLGFIETPVGFLTTPALAMPILIAAAVWLGAGFAMIYLLAALSRVDRDLLDAAALDGAGTFGRFRHVTLPQLRPTLAFLAVAGLVWGMQVFELPYALFGGPGPGYRVLTISMYVFGQAFQQGRGDYAAAVAILSAGLIAGLTIIAALSLRLGKEEVRLG